MQPTQEQKLDKLVAKFRKEKIKKGITQITTDDLRKVRHQIYREKYGNR